VGVQYWLIYTLRLNNNTPVNAEVLWTCWLWCGLRESAPSGAKLHQLFIVAISHKQLLRRDLIRQWEADQMKRHESYRRSSSDQLV
jgi:hypothetical protein